MTNEQWRDLSEWLRDQIRERERRRIADHSMFSHGEGMAYHNVLDHMRKIQDSHANKSLIEAGY